MGPMLVFQVNATQSMIVMIQIRLKKPPKVDTYTFSVFFSTHHFLRNFTEDTIKSRCISRMPLRRQDHANDTAANSI